MTGPGPSTASPGPDRNPGPASPDSSPPSPTGPADPSATEPADLPLRVTTLELFFDLVFAFTLTQLAALLEHDFRSSGALEVLLVFGVLWWMYGGYAWPHGFGQGDTGDKVALGLGYLLVVVLHSALFYRVNRNIVRVTPFNITAALLVIGAAFTPVSAAYLLWTAAVALQWFSPLITHPGGRIDIRPAHYTERTGALVIVALGESIAAIGIGAAPAGVTFAVALAAVLGLAVSAALWWTYFGDGDDERAEQAMSAADLSRRAPLALATYYAHVPILLGVVTLAAGAFLTIGNPTRPLKAGEAVAVAGGAALFLAGTAWFRLALRIGPIALRLAGATFALATAAVGVAVSTEAQLAVLLAGIVAMLGAEHRASARARAEAAT